MALAPLIAGRPDDKLITAQWDDVLRLTALVRTVTVSASLLLKRLGAYPTVRVSPTTEVWPMLSVAINLDSIRS